MPWQCFMTKGFGDHRSEQPGAIWRADEGGGKMGYFMCLPNGQLWHVTGKPANGIGWNITGEAPNLTAHPSINSLPIEGVQGYHGWLQNGVLSDDVEGRTFPDSAHAHP